MSEFQSWVRGNGMAQKAFIFGIAVVCLLLAATPSLAHHAMDGKMPSNFSQGFLSGLAHPVIGLDHLAFIVSVGLLAVTKKQGLMIPVAFALAAMAGTGLHISSIELPAVELLVSGSILLFGILLAANNSLNSLAITALSVCAGLFHGYAYGEAIFGAETTPLLSYLAGFTIVQLAISLAAFGIGRSIAIKHDRAKFKFYSAGLVICGIGATFFASQIIELIFPATS
jgi:urease accessory protein